MDTVVMSYLPYDELKRLQLAGFEPRIIETARVYRLKLLYPNVKLSKPNSLTWDEYLRDIFLSIPNKVITVSKARYPITFTVTDNYIITSEREFINKHTGMRVKSPNIHITANDYKVEINGTFYILSPQLGLFTPVGNMSWKVIDATASSLTLFRGLPHYLSSIQAANHATYTRLNYIEDGIIYHDANFSSFGGAKIVASGDYLIGVSGKYVEVFDADLRNIYNFQDKIDTDYICAIPDHIIYAKGTVLIILNMQTNTKISVPWSQIGSVGFTVMRSWQKYIFMLVKGNIAIFRVINNSLILITTKAKDIHNMQIYNDVLYAYDHHGFINVYDLELIHAFD